MLRRLLLAMAGALIAAFAIAAPAWALEATVTPGRSIESVSEGEISFRGGIFTIRCPLTLRGELRTTTISFTRGEEFGRLTGVSIGRCSGGTVERVLINERERAWPLKFEFELPAAARKENLTNILYSIERAAFQLAVFGEAVRCLYEGRAGALGELVNRGEDRRGGWLYGFEKSTALEALRLPLIRGGEFCPATGSFAGRFRAPTPAQTITVR